MFEATDSVLNTILVSSNISYKSLNSYCEQRDFDRHEIFYFLKRKNSLSCSVTYFSVFMVCSRDISICLICK
jgi:hypothetical protein